MFTSSRDKRCGNKAKKRGGQENGRGERSMGKEDKERVTPGGGLKM